MYHGMAVKLLKRMAGPEGNYPPGSVVPCGEKEAMQMIKGGYAVAIDEPKIAEPQKEEPKKEIKKPKKAVKKNVRK